MMRRTGVLFALAFVIVVVQAAAISQGEFRSAVDAITQGNAVKSLSDGSMWVPWFSSSTSCEVSDLHACGGIPSTNERDCLVTDEFSQLGILLAEANDTGGFDGWKRMLYKLNSSFGPLPGWRVLRIGEDVFPCASGVNGNCDTASDADARIVIALYEAGHVDDARAYGVAFLEHDFTYECRENNICYWLASGARAAQGGRSSGNFAYTGYFPDAITALEYMCEDGINGACEARQDVVNQYLIAANWTVGDFSVPPGKAFKWVGDVAVCTDTCSPPMWDAADAPRAFAFCSAIEATDAQAQLYCDDWEQQGGILGEGTVIQYVQDGVPAGSIRYDYIASGLEAQFWASRDPVIAEENVVSAMSHFDGTSWDGGSCAGIYFPSMPLRAYGVLLGGRVVQVPVQQQQPEQPLSPPESPVQQQAFQELLQAPLQQESFGGYVPAYTDGDLPLVVEDGIGTVGAAVVEVIPLAVLGFVILIGVSLLPKRI